MAWGLTLDALATQRNEAIVKAQREPVHRSFEQLGRAHRWLDEGEEARRWFRAAAADLDERIEQRGRGSADRRGQTGALLRLAGEDADARRWLQWAMETSAGDSDGQLADRAAWTYLLGDREGCLESASRLREPAEYGLTRAVTTLARASLAGDPAPLAAVVGDLADAIRADRLPPAHKSGAAAGGLYDWLEEAFRVEAVLGGTAVPDHPTMLARAGLLDGGAAPVAISLPAEGRWSVPRQAPDGATVDLVLTREGGETDALLDPRVGTELSVIFTEHLGEVRMLIEWGEDEEGWVEEKLGPYVDLAEAADVAADWLRAYAPEPPGGAWAAEALGALLAVAQGS